MFTGIVQGTARIDALADRPGLRTFTLAFPPGFCAGLEIGASVNRGASSNCSMYFRISK